MRAACPTIPVSWGELLDKITILEIKRARIVSPTARANVARELGLLCAAAGDVRDEPGVDALIGRLKAVNEALWDIEDAIRAEEAGGRFGEAFVTLARAVYQRNDARAALKREINLRLRSGLTEEKSYAAANPPTTRAAATA